MTNVTVHPGIWEDTTPDDRRIPWQKVTAPDARRGPLSTHLVMASRGMVHSAPWWVDGVLYTDNSRWLALIRTLERKLNEHMHVEPAPDGPPDEYRAQVEAMRRHAEAHGLHPVTTPAPPGANPLTPAPYH